MKKIIIVWDSIEIGGVDKYLYNLLISNKFQKKSITILTNHNNKAKEYLGNKLKNLKGISILTYYSFFCVSFSRLSNESNIFFFKANFILIIYLSIY